jgi:hypothetical protein
MSPFPLLKKETDPVSETLFFSGYLEFRTMDKVQKSSDSEDQHHHITVIIYILRKEK